MDESVLFSTAEFRFFLQTFYRQLTGNFVAVASLQPFDFKGFVVMTVMAVQQTIPKGCAKHMVAQISQTSKLLMLLVLMQIKLPCNISHCNVLSEQN